MLTNDKNNLFESLWHLLLLLINRIMGAKRQINQINDADSLFAYLATIENDDGIPTTLPVITIDREVKLLHFYGLSTPKLKSDDNELNEFEIIQSPLITSAGLKTLANIVQQDYFYKLTHLTFNRVGLTDDFIKILSEEILPKLANLKTLDLAQNKIGDIGISALAEAILNTNLQKLDLTCNCDITKAGIDKLCDALKQPQCKVHSCTVGYSASSYNDGSKSKDFQKQIDNAIKERKNSTQRTNITDVTISPQVQDHKIQQRRS